MPPRIWRLDSDAYHSSMLRWFGTSMVFAGCALLSFDGRWNPHITSIPGPGSHGLHALEALGFFAAAVGVGAFWIGARRR